MAVKVDGADKIIQRMYAFDKDVWKVLQKEVREATDDIRKDAQRATPSRALRKWGPWNVDSGSANGYRNVTRDLGFSGTQVARSIKSQARSRAGRGGADRTIAGRVVINDAAGAIFSLAGKRNPDAFGGHIVRKYGTGPSGSSTWPRLLSPAWSANKDAAVALIEAAVNKAAREVTRG